MNEYKVILRLKDGTSVDMDVSASGAKGLRGLLDALSGPRESWPMFIFDQSRGGFMAFPLADIVMLRVSPLESASR
jgi:hypothetical protein